MDAAGRAKYIGFMKRRFGLDRALPPIAPQVLEEMPTGALLARLKRLRWCEEERECSDLTDHEIASAADLILFKSDPRWQIAYADVKAVLATREHCPRKP